MGVKSHPVPRFCSYAVVDTVYVFSNLVLVVSLPTQQAFAAQHFILCPCCHRQSLSLPPHQLQHVSSVPVIRPQMCHPVCSLTAPSHWARAHPGGQHMTHMPFGTAPPDCFPAYKPCPGCLPVRQDIITAAPVPKNRIFIFMLSPLCISVRNCRIPAYTIASTSVFFPIILSKTPICFFLLKLKLSI